MSKDNKKSYNPFKMWGSWIGLIIGISLKFIIYSSLFTPFYIIAVILVNLNFINILLLTSGICHTDCYGLLKISSPVVFFLYGWGIHSLFRKIKSK